MMFIFIKERKMKAKLKGACKSWTVWFNSMAVALVVMWPEIEAQIQATLTPDQLRTFAMFTLIVNIGLRVKTAKALADK